jgi:hypothetical protein
VAFSTKEVDINRYGELEPLDEESLMSVRRSVVQEAGGRCYCTFCGASARTWGREWRPEGFPLDYPTVHFRCSTMWHNGKGWKQSKVCKRIAEEDNRADQQ